jgi:hypothetical protein
MREAECYSFESLSSAKIFFMIHIARRFVTALFFLLLFCTGCNNAPEYKTHTDSAAYTPMMDTVTAVGADAEPSADSPADYEPAIDSVGVLPSPPPPPPPPSRPRRAAITRANRAPASVVFDSVLKPVSPVNSAPNTITLPTVAEQPAVKKSATMGIAYHRKMRLNETKKFSVSISIKNGHALLKQEIRDDERESRPDMKENDTSVIVTRPIDIYRYMNVTLVGDDDDFEITPLHRVDRQEVDSLNTTQWIWNVKAISTNKRRSNITVVAMAETPEGVREQLRPTEMEVTILFNWWDVFRSWLVYLFQHPEYTVPSLVVPLLIYLFRKRRRKQTKEETVEEEEVAEEVHS